MSKRTPEPSDRLIPGQAAVTLEVVLCTFNGERFIAEQLRSILAQTRPVDLISVYDDGSSDATLTLVEACATEAAAVGVRICAVRNERNLGYAQNFGHGLERSSCEIVLFSDQDDVWEPTKVERLLGVMEQRGCAMAFSDGTLIDAHGASIPGPTVLQGYGLSGGAEANFNARAWPLLLRRNYVNGAAMAVRRKAAMGALPIPDAFPHDYWLALWLAEEGGIVCMPEPLYRYRQHQNNTIGVGRSTLHHQLAAIWRNPSPSRRQDLRRSKTLLERLPVGDPRRVNVEEKYAWLVRVADERNRLLRMINIANSWLRGEYSQFGPPYALLRDLVAAIRLR
ncbi:MAG: glycosyltransferase [Gallionella sp.]|nr:glycosyltransferase [Gallionella sp.]